VVQAEEVKEVDTGTTDEVEDIWEEEEEGTDSMTEIEKEADLLREVDTKVEAEVEDITAETVEIQATVVADPETISG
jgi:hypothetical protein